MPDFICLSLLFLIHSPPPVRTHHFLKPSDKHQTAYGSEQSWNIASLFLTSNLLSLLWRNLFPTIQYIGQRENLPKCPKFQKVLIHFYLFLRIHRNLSLPLDRISIQFLAINFWKLKKKITVFPLIFRYFLSNFYYDFNFLTGTGEREGSI